MRNITEYRALLRAAQYPHPAKIYAREACRLIGCGLIAYMFWAYLQILGGSL